MTATTARYSTAGTVTRVASPARTFDDDGTERWTVDGVLHRDDGPAVIDTCGDRWWYQHGVRHRDGAPAGECAGGSVEWWRNGLCHRDGGPAVEGGPITVWYRNGELHRTDGPAVTFSDGTTEWWIGGRRLPDGDIDLWCTVDDGGRDMVTDLYGGGTELDTAIATARRIS